MFYYDGYNLAKTEKNAVVVFGGSLDNSIPVDELAKSFDFNFRIFNKSVAELSIKDSLGYFSAYIKPMRPEAMILHIGERDLNLFKANSSEFDSLYIKLIEEIRYTNSKCRLALVSLYNETSNQTVAEMNRHIKAIADSEKCDFIDVENAKLWKPESAKAAIRFAQNMGLAVKKPLRDIAEILYSYAYKMQTKFVVTGLAG
ncbi:MAG: hypothetical protein K6A15_09560 [Treponema sp.]|nr:hypothetical protein [Treponema sp.]